MVLGKRLLAIKGKQLILYCEFITIRGIPIFVKIVDSMKPSNPKFNKYMSLYKSVLTTAVTPRMFISTKICCFSLRPRK